MSIASKKRRRAARDRRFMRYSMNDLRVAAQTTPSVAQVLRRMQRAREERIFELLTAGP